jgi:hypothetical protein
MKDTEIFILKPDFDRFQELTAKADEFWDNQSLKFSEGNSIANDWQSLNLEIMDEDMLLPSSDFPSFPVSYIPIFSEQAKDELEETIKDFGEFLEATLGSDTYYLFNITTHIDCLDLEQSDLEVLSSGTILKIKKAVFKSEIQFPAIFKLSNMPLGDIFVTRKFKEIVNNNGLKGFCFEPCVNG